MIWLLIYICNAEQSPTSDGWNCGRRCNWALPSRKNRLWREKTPSSRDFPPGRYRRRRRLWEFDVTPICFNIFVNYSKSMYPKGYIRRILPLIAAISNHISTKIICSVYVFRHVNYDIHRIFFVCNNACLNLILIVFVWSQIYVTA